MSENEVDAKVEAIYRNCDAVAGPHCLNNGCSGTGGDSMVDGEKSMDAAMQLLRGSLSFILVDL